jgi:hypothetical protein
MQRQRVARVVRAVLPFATTLANQIVAINRFICHDNLTRAAAEREHSMDSTTDRPGVLCRQSKVHSYRA